MHLLSLLINLLHLYSIIYIYYLTDLTLLNNAYLNTLVLTFLKVGEASGQMKITNPDLIVMNYKQILGRAFVWLKDQAFMTQWNCSLKFIHLPLTGTTGISFLFVFIPIYLK